MSEKTLKQLRERAKTLGLKGYSKLGKAELLRRLGSTVSSSIAAKPSAPNERRNETVRVRRMSARKTPADKQVASPRVDAPTASSDVSKTVSADIPPAATRSNREELVEDAKYALRPQGGLAPSRQVDLGEDIDRLPALNEPLVCLLPQKPGVLYAYWQLSSEDIAARNDYRLRLSGVGAGAAEVYEEVAIRHDRGGWYFHVPQSMSDREMAVQLGYYRDGRFVAAHGQSVARLPRLYASMRTDHRWWIAADEFERLYRRAGGVVAARQLRWTASTGSPSTSRDETMSWPGGVSSQSR
jgi:uncharacterized protein DUF4912